MKIHRLAYEVLYGQNKLVLLLLLGATLFIIIPENGAEAQQVFSDPRGRFTVNVPQGWEAEPAKNRFEDVQMTFRPLDGTGGSMNIVVANGIAETINDLGLMGYAEFALSTDFGGEVYGEMEQNVECEVYKVQGHEACSYIISTDQATAGEDLILMQIITMIDGIGYFFSYGNYPNDFDGELPIFEQIINSFRTVSSP